MVYDESLNNLVVNLNSLYSNITQLQYSFFLNLDSFEILQDNIKSLSLN